MKHHRPRTLTQRTLMELCVWAVSYLLLRLVNWTRGGIAVYASSEQVWVRTDLSDEVIDTLRNTDPNTEL